MDAYTAVMIIEGNQDAETIEEYLEAAQTLVDTGLAWQLQGFFGRTCAELIKQGLIKSREEPRE
jgi:hypothetical protein